jgi:transcription initiation factor TFIID subunit TAF12
MDGVTAAAAAAATFKPTMSQCMPAFRKQQAPTLKQQQEQQQQQQQQQCQQQGINMRQVHASSVHPCAV